MRRLTIFERYGFWPIAGAEGDGTGEPPATPPATPTPAPSTADPERKFTQAELDGIVKDRLDRERRKADEQARKAADDAEAKRLTEQNEFKTLAEQRQARIAELEPLQTQLEEAETAVKALLEQERKAVPAHILPLLDELSPAKQLQYIAAHRDDLTKPANGTAGVPGTPRPATPQTSTEREAHYQQRIVSTGAYDHL